MNFSWLNNKRNKIIIYALSAIVILIIFRQFLFSGVLSKIKSLRQQIKLEEANLKAAVEIEQSKDKITQERSKYQNYLQPSDGSGEQEIIARFLKEVETMAQDSGISIVSFNPQNQALKEAEYRKYSAELRAEGSLNKIYNFLYKIQSSSLLIKLDKIIIAPKDPQAQLIKLDTTISIIVL